MPYKDVCAQMALLKKERFALHTSNLIVRVFHMKAKRSFNTGKDK